MIIYTLISFISGFVLSIWLGRRRTVRSQKEKDYILEKIKLCGAELRNREIEVFGHRCTIPSGMVITQVTFDKEIEFIHLQVGEEYYEYRWFSTDGGYTNVHHDMMIDKSGVMVFNENNKEKIRILSIENGIITAEVSVGYKNGNETRYVNLPKTIAIKDFSLYIKTAQQGVAPEPALYQKEGNMHHGPAR